MTWLRMVPLVMAAAGVQTCAAGVTYPELTARTGQPLSEWVRQFGEPHSVDKHPDGTRTAHWAWTTSRVAGGYRGPPVPNTAVTASGKVVTSVSAGDYVAPHLEVSACALEATVGADDRVLGFEAHGDGCRDILNYPDLRQSKP